MHKIIINCKSFLQNHSQLICNSHSYTNFKYSKTFALDKFPNTYEHLNGIIKNLGGTVSENFSNYIDSALIKYNFEQTNETAEIFIADAWEELHLETNDKDIFEKIIGKIDEKKMQEKTNDK